jgi:hypothetical protein
LLARATAVSGEVWAKSWAFLKGWGESAADAAGKDNSALTNVDVSWFGLARNALRSEGWGQGVGVEIRLGNLRACKEHVGRW